jgi:4-cresol dehydrogenase (hydroxylating)
LEVVLPDGQILRTGQGSLKNSKSWQSYKWGFGPYVDGLFSQSNLGIVTKMGLWLMPAPPAYKPFVIRVDDDAGLARLVDVTRDLQLRGVVMNGGLICSATYNLGMYKRRSEIWDKPESIPDSAVSKAAQDAGLAMWNCYVALYGTEESIALTEPILRKAYEAVGGEIKTHAEMGDNPYFHHHSEFMRGGLNLSELGLVRWRGNGGGLAWFCPVGAARSASMAEQTELGKRIIAKHNFDYITAWTVAGRALHKIMPLVYDKSDPDEEKRAEECFRELITEFGQRGLAPYRVGTHAMDITAQQYGEVNRVLNTRIKRAVDPNGIIAPGKSGIG